LLVPSVVWQDISLDFVEGLPKVAGKSVILTVVDRLSKYAHFIPLGHPYTAESVARAFFAEIVRLHGMPASIVSDRDPVFTSMFRRSLFKASGSTLLMTSVFHPQTDRQTEAINKAIGMYLRCLTGDRPRQWLRWRCDPPSLCSYDASEIRVVAISQNLSERDEFLQDVHVHLEQAQQEAKCDNPTRDNSVLSPKPLHLVIKR
jgi:hypothetical protein